MPQGPETYGSKVGRPPKPRTRKIKKKIKRDLTKRYKVKSV